MLDQHLLRLFDVAKIVGANLGVDYAMEKFGEFPGFGFDPNSPWQGVRDVVQSAASYGTAGTLASMIS